ncbi:hypothetical protein Bpfe_003718 [Biomphalaria pfeifferi]|uniref:Uncharacterized protein n=1 Tax=Biomphalaria pfeifferi TaxID=112525 RepID=A0AAD8C7C3_BIOPF|nr:hypothetical protein Bpfe_003718 [Biomphalaria pfeifferi]
MACRKNKFEAAVEDGTRRAKVKSPEDESVSEVSFTVIGSNQGIKSVLEVKLLLMKSLELNLEPSGYDLVGRSEVKTEIMQDSLSILNYDSYLNVKTCLLEFQKRAPSLQEETRKKTEVSSTLCDKQ